MSKTSRSMVDIDDGEDCRDIEDDSTRKFIRVGNDSIHTRAYRFCFLSTRYFSVFV